MQTIKEIENAVLKLPKKDLMKFRDWFIEYDAELWDEQFENDVKKGRLDSIADNAINEYKNGRCKEI